jgi:hypothetical protein
MILLDFQSIDVKKKKTIDQCVCVDSLVCPSSTLLPWVATGFVQIRFSLRNIESNQSYKRLIKVALVFVELSFDTRLATSDFKQRHSSHPRCTTPTTAQ